MSGTEPHQRRFAGLRRAFGLTARELRESNRSPGPYRLRGGLLTIMLLIGWWAVAEASRYEAPGVVVLGVLAWSNAIALMFMGPVLFAGPLPEEKEAGTLGLLKLSGFSGLAILSGKGLSQLVQAVAALAMQLPFAVLCRTLGGVDADQILGVYALLLGGCFAVFGIGTLAGTVCTSGRKAVSVTAWSMAAFELGSYVIWLLGAWIQGSVRTGPRGIFKEWGGLTMHQSMGSLFRGGARFSDVVPTLQAFGILGLACLLIAWAVFERATMREPKEASPGFHPMRSLGALAGAILRTRRRSGGAGGSTAAKRPTVLCPWLDAVLWRDFHHGLGGWNAMTWRVVVLTTVAIVLPLAFDGRADLEVFAGFLVSLGLMGLAAMAAGAAGSAFRDEIREQTLGGLVALPAGRRGRSYRWSKARAIALSMLPGAVVAAMGVLLVILDGETRFLTDEDFWFASGGIAAGAVFTLLLIVYLSLAMRRGAAAVGLLLGLSSFGMLGGFLDEVFRMRDEEVFFTLMVIYTILSALMFRWIGRRLDKVEATVT